MRTLHPRSNGHKIIADIILWHMAVDEERFLGLETPPLPGSETCPLYGNEVQYRAVDDLKENRDGMTSNFEFELDNDEEEDITESKKETIRNGNWKLP